MTYGVHRGPAVDSCSDHEDIVDMPLMVSDYETSEGIMGMIPMTQTWEDNHDGGAVTPTQMERSTHSEVTVSLPDDVQDDNVVGLPDDVVLRSSSN